MELNSHFQKFLSNIEPTANQKAEAASGHNVLRSRLETSDDYKSYFLDSFLSGSYGRDTAIQPIKDVDVIIITKYAESVWRPDIVLYHLKGELRKYYEGKLTLQSRSVRVSLSYVVMDVVPAIRAGDNFIKVPDRTAQNWVISNPRKHIEMSTTMNTKRNGLYKPLVKTIKHWRDNRMPDLWKPKSFLLECLVYDFANSSEINSIPRALNGFFAFIHGKYNEYRRTHTNSPLISDPAGTGIDVAKKWTYADFCKFMDEVGNSWNVCYQALTSQDKNESVTKWKQLLGDAFPSEP